MLLAGEVVFVTGSASGIGRECALAYVREGASVMIAGIDGARAEETARPAGQNAAAIDCDVITGCILPVSGGAELGYRR